MKYGGALLLSSIAMLNLGPIATIASAQSSSTPVHFYVNQKEVQFDVAPFLQNDRTFVPFRALIESLGADVRWDQASQTAYADKGSLHLQIPLKSYRIYLNNQAISMDAPTQLIHDRIMVPARFISQALGGTVNYRYENGQLLVFVDNASTSPSSPTASAGSEVVVTTQDPTVTSERLAYIRRLLTDHQIAEDVQSHLQMQFNQPVSIQLVQGRSSYESALIRDGHNQSDAKIIAQNSVGLALGNDIYILLEPNQSQGDLLNVLAHELVHILMNQNSLNSKVPSWVAEGIAWREGLREEYKLQPQILAEGRQFEIKQPLWKALSTGTWQPLLTDSWATITAEPGYNVESQDYEAMNRLYERFGSQKVFSYLTLLQGSSTAESAFITTFGQTPATFESQFKEEMKTETNRPDRAVSIQIKIHPSFQGTIAILPKNQTTWKGFRLQPGTYTFTIQPDGTIGGIPVNESYHSSDAPDPNTLYIGITPDSPVQEGNHNYDFGGYAIPYASGDYAYGNSWKSPVQQGSQAGYDTNVLGVEIVSVSAR